MKFLTVLVAGATLAACAAPSSSSAPPSHPASTKDLASHLLVSDWVNGDDAKLALRTGVLVVQADGCVGMRLNESEEPVLLNWPSGSMLASDGSAVIGESGRRFDIGKEIGLGGGFGNTRIPKQCSESVWGGVFDVQQPL